MQRDRFKIFRISGGFTAISNSCLRDARISTAAKGLMAIILSLPPDWNYSFNGLLQIVNEGRTWLRKRLDELKEAGYLEIQEVRQNGRFFYCYNIYEIANRENIALECVNSTEDRKAVCGETDYRLTDTRFSDTRFSDNGKCAAIKTNNNKKQKKQKNISPANKELNNLNNLEDGLSINNEIECKEETIQDNTKERKKFEHLQEKYDIKTEIMDYLISVAKSYEVDNPGGYITELIAKIKAHNLERLSDVKKAIPLKAEKDSFLCSQQRKNPDHGMILSSADQIKDFQQNIPDLNETTALKYLFDLDLFDAKEDVV